MSLHPPRPSASPADAHRKLGRLPLPEARKHGFCRGRSVSGCDLSWQYGPRPGRQPRRSPRRLRSHHAQLPAYSCRKALWGDEEHRDPPRVAYEKAPFAILGRDACRPHPLVHGGDLLRFVEHDGPVAQTHPVRRGGRYAVAAPDIEAEVVMVAASRHERRCAGYERHELEAEHVGVEAHPPVQVADMQVEVADRQPGTRLATRLLASDGG